MLQHTSSSAKDLERCRERERGRERWEATEIAFLVHANLVSLPPDDASCGGPPHDAEAAPPMTERDGEEHQPHLSVLVGRRQSRSQTVRSGGMISAWSRRIRIFLFLRSMFLFYSVGWHVQIRNYENHYSCFLLHSKAISNRYAFITWISSWRILNNTFVHLDNVPATKKRAYVEITATGSK